jgi:hypothetical protein
MDMMSSYEVYARFRHRIIDCGFTAASSVMEAIDRMKKRKEDWAADALDCRPEHITWEAKERD